MIPTIINRIMEAMPTRAADELYAKSVPNDKSGMNQFDQDFNHKQALANIDVFYTVLSSNNYM